LLDTLDPVFGFTSLVRFSWSTADIILREKAVPVHWYIYIYCQCYVRRSLAAQVGTYP